MSLTWNWNPLVLVALLLPTWMYYRGVLYLWGDGRIGRGVAAWQVGAFVLGIITLFIALVSPVDTLGEQILTAHMVQHVLLMLVAPPLLVIGTPSSIFLWVLPLRWRRAVGRTFAPGTSIHRGWRALSAPLSAWVLHAGAIWLWHLPSLYQAALTDATVHWLEHVSFFGTALLFWRAALLTSKGKASLLGALLIFTTTLHSSILGALMTFSRTVWYPFYIERTQPWGLSALEDQQLAGLIMWIPAGVIYLIAALILIGVWLNDMEKTATTTPHVRGRHPSKRAEKRPEAV